MKHPIPDAALDDRLAFVGTSGSGKTFGAGTAVERILGRGDRAVIIDPLGVWWGLRSLKDGSTPPGFDVVILGGAYGDLPINEASGALIGEAVATMTQSCIIDLSDLGTKAAERRFMLAFLEVIYRKATGEPLHLVFDEADLWAPQRTSEPQLQSKVEQIVRRGRVKGFIPWLITQRPAVLSKDVLSQADGLVAFKLTSSHDRDAIGDWVQGQADKDQWKRIWADMATMQRGEAVTWIPGRGILTKSQFPPKMTFDSSRTPKRGEKRGTALLKPLDLGRLREKLTSVEAETKANDPRALRAEIARLKSENAKNIPKNIPDPEVETVRIAAAEWRGYAKGYADALKNAAAAVACIQPPNDTRISESAPVRLARPPAPIGNGSTVGTQSGTRPSLTAEGDKMPGGHRKVLTVLAQYPQGRSKTQVAILTGYSHNGGAFNNYLSALRSAGHIEGRGENLRITETGLSALGAFEPLPTGTELQAHWMAQLGKAERECLRILIHAYPAGLSKQDLADRAGYAANAGGFNNALSRLRSLELAGGRGELRASDNLF